MKYIRFGVYLLLVFLLIFSFLVLPKLIKVKAVECYNQYGLCSDELLTKVNTIVGDSFEAAKKKVTEEFNKTKLIDTYSFRFKLPATLRIDLILKKPKYALFQKITDEKVVLDDSGVVLEKVKETNLPYIVVPDNLPDIGETVGNKKTFALELLYGVYYLYQVKSGEILDDYLEVNVPGAGKVIFPLAGERDTLLGSLKLILSRLNTDTNSPKIGKVLPAGRQVKEIDLRYKNPVIRRD